MGEAADTGAVEQRSERIVLGGEWTFPEAVRRSEARWAADGWRRVRIDKAIDGSWVEIFYARDESAG